jgi:hypothetical protein
MTRQLSRRLNQGVLLQTKPLLLNTTPLFCVLQQALSLGLAAALFFRANASFFLRTKASVFLGSQARLFLGFAASLFLDLATSVFLVHARFNFFTAASLNLDTAVLFFLCLSQRRDFGADSLLFLRSFAGGLFGLFSNCL